MLHVNVLRPVASGNLASCGRDLTFKGGGSQRLRRRHQMMRVKSVSLCSWWSVTLYDIGK